MVDILVAWVLIVVAVGTLVAVVRDILLRRRLRKQYTVHAVAAALLGGAGCGCDDCFRAYIYDQW